MRVVWSDSTAYVVAPYIEEALAEVRSGFARRCTGGEPYGRVSSGSGNTWTWPPVPPQPAASAFTGCSTRAVP